MIIMMIVFITSKVIIIVYRVARTHRMLYADRSFPAKVPYDQ
jgi:hypothetical protein